MEYIRKSIYKLPEIRHILRPLWAAWAMAFIGVVCAAVYFLASGLSAGVSSMLLSGMIVGGCSLLTVLCCYLFGDSHRPYSRELKAMLEPTYTYYAYTQQGAVTEALMSCNETALDAIKRNAKPELALVRYSDKDERIFYSQLTMVEGKHYKPLTDIIINRIK